MNRHAKRTERKSPGIYIVTQKGQAILFFILHPFFVGRTENRDAIFVFCKTPPFTVKGLTMI